MLALAVIFDFEVWSSAFELAYLQSAELLTRRVYIKNPAHEFGLEPNKGFELFRPPYRLSDADDLWKKRQLVMLSINQSRLISIFRTCE